MKKIYKKSLLGLALILSSCGAESPFSPPAPNPSGKDDMCEFHKSAINLDVKSDDNVWTPTRGGETDVNINNFKISFMKDGEVVKTHIYGEMPDIVMLEKGVYQVIANYGEDRPAEWENPVFYGESGEFEVSPEVITTDIDPIKCVLKNVKVCIVFDQELANSIGDDGYIEVKVGNGQGLKYYKDETRAGYFRIQEEKTLVATFHGKINDTEISETKSLDNIEGGVSYEVTFKLHSHNGINQGDANTNVNVDASVDYENIENNVTVKNELLTDDSERPKQDDGNEDDNKGNGDDPGTSDEEGPKVSAREPIVLDDWNVAVEGLSCVLDVHSESGITGFKVKINSATLTDEILTGVGLASEFDLISCKTAAGADVKEGLSGLGLPVADEVEGQKDVVFDVSQFMGLLGIYGAADHVFVLTVSDAQGTTVKELKLRTE